MKKKPERIYIPPDGPLFYEKIDDILKKYPHVYWGNDNNLYFARPRTENGYHTYIGVYSNEMCDDYHYEEYFSFEISFGRFTFGFSDLDFAIKFFLITLTENIRLTKILLSGKEYMQMGQIYWNGEWIEIRNIVIKKPLFPSIRKKEIVYMQNNWLPNKEIDSEVIEKYVNIVKSKKIG